MARAAGRRTRTRTLSERPTDGAAASLYTFPRLLLLLLEMLALCLSQIAVCKSLRF